MFKDTIEDCKKSVQLDAANANAHFLSAKCLVKLGNFPLAEKSLISAISAGHPDCNFYVQGLALLMEEVKMAYHYLSINDFQSCLLRVEKVENTVTHSVQLKILKAKALAGLQRNFEVITLTEYITSIYCHGNLYV